DAESVPVGYGPGGHRKGIRAGLRFGHSVHGDLPARAEFRQQPGLLIFRAMQPDRNDAGKQMSADGKNEASVVASVSEGFQRHGRRDGIRSDPTILLIDGQALNAHFPAFEKELSREGLIPITLPNALVQLRMRESDDFFSKQLLLFGVAEVHQAICISVW